MNATFSGTIQEVRDYLNDCLKRRWIRRSSVILTRELGRNDQPQPMTQNVGEFLDSLDTYIKEGNGNKRLCLYGDDEWNDPVTSVSVFSNKTVLIEYEWGTDGPSEEE